MQTYAKAFLFTFSIVFLLFDSQFMLMNIEHGITMPDLCYLNSDKNGIK